MALIVIIAMLASLITMVAMKQDPWANIDTAAAQGGASSGDELVVVPVALTQNEDAIAVFVKGEVKNLAGGGTKPEWNMVVYQIENRQKIKIIGARRIEYDRVLSNYNLNQNDAKSLSPKDLAKKAKDGDDAGDDAGKDK
ncbi:MAG: hypothetical protein AB7S36_14625 [Planctomycetota bacterium]